MKNWQSSTLAYLNWSWFEFRYALEAMTPGNGWDSVVLESQNEIEQKVNPRDFLNPSI
jgi:hypothetical protein